MLRVPKTFDRGLRNKYTRGKCAKAAIGPANVPSKEARRPLPTDDLCRLHSGALKMTPLKMREKYIASPKSGYKTTKREADEGGGEQQEGGTRGSKRATRLIVDGPLAATTAPCCGVLRLQFDTCRCG